VLLWSSLPMHSDMIHQWATIRCISFSVASSLSQCYGLRFLCGLLSLCCFYGLDDGMYLWFGLCDDELVTRNLCLCVCLYLLLSLKHDSMINLFLLLLSYSNCESGLNLICDTCLGHYKLYLVNCNELSFRFVL
jgi:hypothetical protein